MSAEHGSQGKPTLESRVIDTIGSLLAQNAVVTSHTNSYRGLAQLDVEQAVVNTPAGDLKLTHRITHPEQMNTRPKLEAIAEGRSGSFRGVQIYGETHFSVKRDAVHLEGEARTSFLEGILEAKVDLPGTEQLLEYIKLAQIDPPQDGRTIYLRDLSEIQGPDDIDKLTDPHNRL